MASVPDQAFTLVGVGLGAIMTYVINFMGERVRFRRDIELRWHERKLDAYINYVNDVKAVHKLARRIAAARGLHDRDIPLEPEEGMADLADAITRRSRSSELLTVFAGAETRAALRTLNDEIRCLIWYARGVIPDATPEGWDLAFSEFMLALDQFHEHVRLELHIPGAQLQGKREYTRPGQASRLSGDTNA